MKILVASIVVALALLSGCGFDASGAGIGPDGPVGPIDGGPSDDTTSGSDTSSIDGVAADAIFPVDDVPATDTRVPGVDGCVATDVGCTSTGKCHSGVVNCDGTCTAAPDPKDYGATCDSPKHCTTGTVKCDGSCSAVDPPTVDVPCASPLGCSKGVIDCSARCNAAPDPKEAGKPCPVLKCATPPKSDCAGACPAKDVKSGSRCRCCICIDLSVKSVNYDDCAECAGCPGGCTDTICL